MNGLQDGKPYILYMCAGPAHEDPRSQGYNFVAKSEFANMDDMKFYDFECTAHQTLKATAAELGIGPPMTVYYTAAPVIKV